MALRELHLFAGAGGGILGGLLLGHVPVCAVELEEYPRSVLLQRQRDGILPWFPVWDDVCTFDGNPWRGHVDAVCGGFPCQDISAAGRGEGIDGARSGLWREFARIVREVRPRYVFVENSPMLTSRGLGTVLGDLAALGFDAEWGVLGADDAGAPHVRKRIWILAHAKRPEWRPKSPRERDHQGGGCPDRLPTEREEMPGGSGAGCELVADSPGFGQQGGGCKQTRPYKPDAVGCCKGGDAGPAQPGMGGVADGLDFGVDEPGTDDPGGIQ